jgi:hypothetical protein
MREALSRMDVETNVGMMSQEIEQLALRNQGDRALCHRDGVGRKGTIVKHGDIGERPARPEHFQNPLTTPPPTS